jgi:hypothetical protein
MPTRVWLTIGVALAAAACGRVSATSMQYVGVPQFPATNPTTVEILRAEPSRPPERLGEVSLTTTTSPAPAMSDVEGALRARAGALAADAVVVVYDRLQPIGAYAPGGTMWWDGGPDRTLYPITGRRLVGVAIKYRE